MTYTLKDIDLETLEKLLNNIRTKTVPEPAPQVYEVLCDRIISESTDESLVTFAKRQLF